ncbi:hypothetical protein [Lentzea sp. NEAU-D7]|uniref:hypothetical protein n=1 Tax=Lentzea sp. NEAU-D7 TaxID=2994667 RepID=UPI00224AF4E6|nr:hypothetical protein [Lentzea sp. NEAU-D7]MCX2947680.1 hypothetical protein [Lentzea sp. NEAU-D7]
MEITGDEIRKRMIEHEALDPGGLKIVGATITGQLDLTDVVAKKPLVLRDCTTERPVLLSRAQFSLLDLRGLVAPSVEARGLTVDHHLQLSGARLNAEESVDAMHMRIGGSVYLDERFRAAGSVTLSGSRVAGVLTFGGGHFEAGLNLVDLQIGDAIFLNAGCEVVGGDKHAAVRMRGTRVDGQIVFREGRFRSSGVALDLRHVRVGKDLLMPFDGIEGQVQLEGLTYEGLPRDTTVDEWLSFLPERTLRYSAQPWTQLASAHQAAGHERDVRRIRVAQQRDLRRRGLLSRWGRIWHLVRGATVGHGYRPGLALVWLAGVLAVSVGVVLVSGAVRCSTIEQVGYALNVATPLVKVDAARCTVDGASGAGGFVLASTWLLQVLAWAFATLFVAGFTGLVRRNA